MFGRNCGGVDSVRRVESSPQEIDLRVLPVFESLAATRIGFAGQQKLLEATRTPKRVRRLQHPQYRRGAQFQGAVAVSVVLGHEDSKVPACVRHRQALRQTADEFRAAPLVTTTL